MGLGWRADQVPTIDDYQGLSGSGTPHNLMNTGKGDCAAVIYSTMSLG